MTGRYQTRQQKQKPLPSSCGACQEPDNESMVQCDGCDVWYHFDCVNLVSITEEESWFCPKCVQDQTIVLNSNFSEGNQNHNSSIDNIDPHREPQASGNETIQHRLKIEQDPRHSSHRYVFEEILLNRLRDNTEVHPSRFTPAMFNQTMANNLTTPVASQGVFMTQRRIFGICSRQQPDCSTPARPPTHQYISHQSTNQQNERFGGNVNESKQTSYYSSNEFQTNRSENNRQQNSTHHERQSQSRYYNQFERDQSCNQSTSSLGRHSEQNVTEPQASSIRTTSTRRKIQIELDKLEEEKIAHQKYLDKKYEILMQKYEEERSTDRKGYTEDWVNNLSRERFDDFVNETVNHSEIRSNPSHRTIPRLEPTSAQCRDAIPTQTSACIPQGSASQSDLARPLDVNDVNVTNNAAAPIRSSDLNTSNDERTLTKRQIASRQVIKSDLPAFDGNPERWPIFYSRYQNSTSLCNYSDDENLDRLQRCLKGKAYEAVKHRLLLPASVPVILSTLKFLFGRPEVIIIHLVKKVDQLVAPKMDKLDTVIDFAMSVQNLSATIVSAELSEYLTNPTLMTGIVNKLPVHVRLDWAKFKMTQPTVNLSTLAKWLEELAQVVATISEPVFTSTDDSKSGNQNSKKSSDNLNKKSEYLNVHHVNPKVESPAKPKVEISTSTAPQIQSKSCIVCHKNCPNVAECNEFTTHPISQRWKLVNSKKLCRTRLRLHFGFCRLSKSCGVNNCTAKHHPLLHDEQHLSKTSENKSRLPTTEQSNFHHQIKVSNEVLLRIIPVQLFGDGTSINTFAFVDDGSTTSLIDQRIVNKLNIKGEPRELCLLWSGTIHRLEKNSHEVNVGVSAIDKDSTIYQLRGVKSVEKLAIPAQRLNRSELLQRFPYLRGVPFDEYEAGLPGILIGSNNPKIGIPLEIVEGGESEPIACKTRIGWTIHGPTCRQDPSTQISSFHSVEECHCDHEHDNDLHQYVKEYFSVENFGVKVDNFMNQDSKENERALEQMRRLTRKVSDGYECGLLWRYDQFDVPDSYGMALRRLQYLENRHANIIEAINNTITDYLAKGYVSKLDEVEIRQTSHRVWYLPIFAVTYPKKPDKIRTVFDAAAKVNGISLNSLLLKGPDQLVSLVEILRRFREKLIAAVGDIREMYHQIKTRAEDKHCQRFLWRNGENRKPDVYVMNVMTFGASCSPSIAHYIKNVNALKFAEQFPQAVETITRNHYVDDMMEGAHNDEEMLKLINEVKKIHADGGFEIRNFLSNSKMVMATLTNGNGATSSVKSIIPEKDVNIERVLGMWWNTDTDCFTFSLKYSPVNEEILLGKRIPTKLEMLKLLMSIFDPLGLISHFLVHLKITIQEIRRTSLRWDQKISEPKIIGLWERWLELLPQVEAIQIPRHYTPKLSSNLSISTELHIFVDAGEDAFGAVCYLRVEDEDGVDCSLVGSKAKVAPIKYLSIPRMELQAAILGTRLSSSISSSQNIVVKRRVFWSDSKTVLSWLRSDHRRFHQFVAHRVGEILESTEQSDWRWIPSKLNVADDMTKWERPPCFDLSSRWFSGPEFLKLPEENWPTSPDHIEETREEMKMNFAHSELTVVRLIDPKRFSSWNRMVRALAYVIRYVRILKSKINKSSIPQRYLTREELIMAKSMVIRQAQFDEYPEEIVTLILNKGISHDQQKSITKSSSIYLCSPYLDDDGIMRIRGRIDLAPNVQNDTKRPIILPRNNHITKLLMKCYHQMYHHRNNETVVNELRQKYYIPKLRVVLKSVIKHECQNCKNRKALPQPPEMASLPFGRLAVGFRPFTYCGVDFFGPIEVVVGRRVEKRWGSLFTCLTVRAVHMEIAHSINTDSFIKCLRNFISLRGRPTEMFSDPGSNFAGTVNALAKAVAEIDFDKVATEFTTSYSKWNFNPPHAPHFGGAWERLVRSVKTSLYAIMTERRPNDETFRNLLMEIQNIINSRPLTFIPLDHENDEALTPNHFLLGSSNGNKPPCSIDLNGPELRHSWKENQRLTELFWKRFVKEYLPTLTRRTKWIEPVKPLEIGDIAINFDSAYPRNSYPKVRIIDRTMDSTGQVRRVKVQFANGSMLWRPASSIARLDVLNKPDATTTNSTVDQSKHPEAETTDAMVTTHRPVSLKDGFTVTRSSSKTEGNVKKPTRSSARIANKR